MSRSGTTGRNIQRKIFFYFFFFLGGVGVGGVGTVASCNLIVHSGNKNKIKNKHYQKDNKRRSDAQRNGIYWENTAYCLPFTVWTQTSARNSCPLAKRTRTVPGRRSKPALTSRRKPRDRSTPIRDRQKHRQQNGQFELERPKKPKLDLSDIPQTLQVFFSLNPSANDI